MEERENFDVKVTPKYVYEVRNSRGQLSRTSTGEDEEARFL